MTTFSVALASAVVLVGVLAAALPRLGVMDVPNHRSSHERPVPRGGGIAFVPCIALGISASGSWTGTLGWVVAAATVLGAIGLADDVRDVPATVRLALQLLVTATLGTALIGTLTDASPAVVLITGLVAAIWLTSFVNVFNFMDGANGVAGLQAAVAGAWFAYVGAREDATVLLVGGLALLGAALGFLPWNFPRARVFLGDVGSYSVGLAIGALALLTLLDTSSVLLAAAPVLVFLADTSITLVRRAAAGKPVMTAHREHAYQRLTTVHGSSWPAIATSGASFACVLAALAPVWVCVVGWVLVLGVYLSLPRLARARGQAAPR